jgi:hypothetical protein
MKTHGGTFPSSFDHRMGRLLDLRLWLLTNGENIRKVTKQSVLISLLATAFM